jgi:hypothetical protein
VPQSRALVVGEKLREKIATLSNMTIIGTLTGSAGMNVYTFAAQASNSYALAAAIALGLAMALIFAFMRLGAALWFDSTARIGRRSSAFTALEDVGRRKPALSFRPTPAPASV